MERSNESSHAMTTETAFAQGSKDPAEIAAQRNLGWPDFHPEDYCHRCGFPEPTLVHQHTGRMAHRNNNMGDGNRPRRHLLHQLLHPHARAGNRTHHHLATHRVQTGATMTEAITLAILAITITCLVALAVVRSGIHHTHFERGRQWAVYVTRTADLSSFIRAMDAASAALGKATRTPAGIDGEKSAQKTCGTRHDLHPDEQMWEIRLSAALGHKEAILFLTDYQAWLRLPMTEFTHPKNPFTLVGSQLYVTELDLDEHGMEIGRRQVPVDLPAGWEIITDERLGLTLTWSAWPMDEETV
jgi:hypothetical protein